MALIAAITVCASGVEDEPFLGDGEIEAGEDPEAELARAVQNPVASLISVPFQNNLNFEVGPKSKTQNILNIQPVYPISLSEEWNLITRTILPVIHQPPFFPDKGRICGAGDLTFTPFLSPARPGKFMWGVGPVFEFPTASDEVLGTEKWSVGPSAVVLRMTGPWVYGTLINNVWSYAGDGDRANVNRMLLQPFINYNMPDGWYLSSSPIITADWEADSSNQWTIPIGGGFGKIFKIGRQPMNFSIQSFYNVESPRNGADWTLRLQLQFLFPK